MRITLALHQVPFGMRVVAFQRGNDQKLRLGGRTLGTLSCRRREGSLLSDFYEIERQRYGPVDLAHRDLVFRPAEVFASVDAPTKTEYSVFVEGERVRYGCCPQVHVRVLKKADGEIVSIARFAHVHFLKHFLLPQNAQLIPLTNYGASAIE